MTNYNERLDEILEELWQYIAHDRLDIGIRPDEARQAITLFIKELVTEAKPKRREDYWGSNPIEKIWEEGYDKAVRDFEQNLLKALEEV